MNAAAILGGLVLGLVSSIHCVGMCGPLVLSLPLSIVPPERRTVSIALYHTGRIISYSILGIIVGLAGSVVAFTGFQQTLSIATGIMVILLGLLISVSKYQIRLPWSASFGELVKKVIIMQLNRRGLSSFLYLGMANGLLPCGMVYIAIGYSFTSADYIGSALIMFAYGIGTVPALMLLTFLRPVVGSRWRKFIKVSMPVMMIVVGMILIGRGLNMDFKILRSGFVHHSATPILCPK
jgi:uncharacterized protein